MQMQAFKAAGSTSRHASPQPQCFRWLFGIHGAALKVRVGEDKRENGTRNCSFQSTKYLKAPEKRYTLTSCFTTACSNSNNRPMCLLTWGLKPSYPKLYLEFQCTISLTEVYRGFYGGTKKNSRAFCSNFTDSS